MLETSCLAKMQDWNFMPAFSHIMQCAKPSIILKVGLSPYVIYGSLSQLKTIVRTFSKSRLDMLSSSGCSSSKIEMKILPFTSPTMSGSSHNLTITLCPSFSKKSCIAEKKALIIELVANSSVRTASYSTFLFI